MSLLLGSIKTGNTDIRNQGMLIDGMVNHFPTPYSLYTQLDALDQLPLDIVQGGRLLPVPRDIVHTDNFLGTRAPNEPLGVPQNGHF